MPADVLEAWFGKTVRPRVIVVGNRKGGSGKSTTAIHLIVGLLHSGYGVGSVDLDGAQATLSHFLANRRRLAEAADLWLEMPSHRRIEGSEASDLVRAEAEESERLAVALEEMQDRDYVVIDTPGSDTLLARLGHTLADILITPLNDSFLDLDVLVRLDLDGRRILGPSDYALAVLDRWGLRMLVTDSPLDWVVIRNRLAHLGTRNHRQLGRLLGELAPRLGFREAPGFGERVIFRELFVRGLTVLDQRETKPANRSHNQARAEIWALLDALGISAAREAARVAARG